MDKGNRMYITLYDSAVEYSFDPKKRDILLKFPAIVPNRVPPHIFGSLGRYANGRTLIRSHLPALIKQLESRSTHERRAAIFALCFYGSGLDTADDLQEVGAIDAMFSSVFSWPPDQENRTNCVIGEGGSLTLVGTLISGLTFMRDSKYFSESLQKYNWQRFTFGEKSAVIPCNPDGFLPIENGKPIKLPVMPPPEGHEVIAKTLMQLASPITTKAGKDALRSYYKERMNEVLQTDLALWGHTLLSKYSFPTDSRQTIFSFFKLTPLAEPRDEDEVNLKVEAQIKAKLFENAKQGFMKPLSEVNVPKMTLGALSGKRN